MFVLTKDTLSEVEHLRLFPELDDSVIGNKKKRKDKKNGE